jgi:hypothetical protein
MTKVAGPLRTHAQPAAIAPDGETRKTRGTGGGASLLEGACTVEDLLQMPAAEILKAAGLSPRVPGEPPEVTARRYLRDLGRRMRRRQDGQPAPRAANTA